MAQIKYLDSRRIMGESDGTDIAPTFEDDFSGSDNWTDANGDTGVNTTTDRFEFDLARTTVNQSSYVDIGSTVSDTEWLLRIHDLKITTKSGGIEVFIGISSNTSGAIGTAQDFIGVAFGDNTANPLAYGVDADNSSITRLGGDYTYSLNTSYYVEVIRTSSTNYDIKIYSDSNFSTLLFSQSYTCTSTTTSLRYLKVANAMISGSTEDLVGSFDKITLFDGVTSVTTGKPKQALSLSGCKAYYNFEQTGTEIAQSTANDFVNVYSSAQHSAGFKLNSASSALNGTTVNSVTFYLKKAGSPTGTAYAKIYNGTTLVETSTNSLDVSTLTTSYQAITFNFAGTTTLSNGYTVAYYYDGGDGSNYTQFNYSTTDAYDSTNTIMRRFASSAWSDITTGDAKFVLNPVLLTNIATTGNGFADGLGSSADGTNNGATTGATGKVGSYAYSFDGSNDTVQLGSSYSDLNFLHDGSSWSIAFWFKDDNSSQTSRIFCTMDDRSGSQRGISVVHETTGLNLGVFTGTASQYPFASTIASVFTDTNTWHHYVLTFTTGDSTATLYKDGSSFGTWTKTGASFNTSNATQYPYIASRFGFDSFMGGDIDEFVIFNRALTSSEVSELYNNGTGVAVNDSSITAKPETNSIFIETDTANRWWFDGTNWNMQTTFEDNFSTDNWTDQDSAVIGVNTTTSAMVYDAERGSNDNSHYDLGTTLSDTNWIWDFDYVETSLSSGGAGDNSIHIYLSSAPSSTNSETSADRIGIGISQFSARQAPEPFYTDGSTIPATGSRNHVMSITNTVNTNRYVRIIRTSPTQYRVIYFTTASRTVELDEHTQTIPSTVTGLRYVIVGNESSANANATNQHQGKITSMKIYNGVTSVQQ